MTVYHKKIKIFDFKMKKAAKIDMCQHINPGGRGEAGKVTLKKLPQSQPGVQNLKYYVVRFVEIGISILLRH